VLHERIYDAVTCLSTLLILVRYGGADSPPSAAAVALAVDAGTRELVRRPQMYG
jgi:hypothetical protein